MNKIKLSGGINLDCAASLLLTGVILVFRKEFLLFAMALMVSCSSRFHKEDEKPTFEKEIASFYKEAESRGYNYRDKKFAIALKSTETTVFGGGESTTIGVCFPYLFPPVILIDPDYWRGADSCQRHALIFHELGHCVLKQNHRNNIKSIMEPIIIQDMCYNWDYYLDELFHYRTKKYPEPRKKWNVENNLPIGDKCHVNGV